VLNHAALIDIELSKFPSLTTVFVANNTALTELHWSGSQPISSVELIDYNGTDAEFKSLPNLVDLKLSRMSNLNYLLIDDASLRSLDLSKVGGSPSSVGLYIDLFNISSTIGNVALLGGGGLENSLTGFEVADYRGGVTSLTLANLSRSLYYDLSGLAALKSIRMENIVLDGVQTKNVLPGVDMLIELVRVRASYGGTELGISHDPLAPDAVARITAVRLIDNLAGSLFVADLPALRSLEVAGSSSLTDLYIGRTALTSLNLSGITGNVDEYFEIGLANFTNKNVPNQLTALKIDGSLNGGALSDSLNEIWMQMDSNSTIRTIELLNLPNMEHFYIDGLGVLTSLRIVDAAIHDDLGVKSSVVSTEGVDLVFENVFEMDYVHFHQGVSLDENFGNSIRSLVLKDDIHYSDSVWVEHVKSLRSLTIQGHQNVSTIGIHGLSGLTSLDLSGVLGRPDSLTIDIQDGISATPTAALPNNRLSMLRLAGGSGLEKSLVKVQLLEENTPGGVEAVDFVNLPRLAYLHINSLPALKSLRINNTGLTELYLNDIDGAPGALDMVLENVASQTKSRSLSIELDGNGDGLLGASLVSFSLKDSTGGFDDITLKALPALKRVTLGGVIDGITLLNISGAELFGFAEVAPNAVYIEIRRSGIAALDLTRVRNAAQVIVTDNTKLSGVCRLPDAYAGTCEINNNAFYADANCASKCSGTVVPRGASNASSCVMPAKPAFCTGTNMIFFNVVNTTAGGVDAPICLSFSSDPSRITSGACTVSFVQASASNMVSFSSCSVSTSTLFATSIALVGTNTHFNVSLGQSANPGCGFVVNGNVPRIVTAGVTATSAVLCTSTSGCATAAPTPAPTPLPTPMPPSPSPSPSPTTRTASVMPTPRPASGVPTPSPTPTTTASGAATTTTDAAGSDSSTSADVLLTTSSESGNDTVSDGGSSSTAGESGSTSTSTAATVDDGVIESRSAGPADVDDNLPIIIGASVGGVCCLVVLGLVAALLYKRKNDSASEQTETAAPTQMRSLTPVAELASVPSVRNEYQQIHFGTANAPPETISARSVSTRSLNSSNDPYSVMPKMNVGGGYDIVPHGTATSAFSESSSYVNLPTATVEEFT
jgi:hypothetical protein